MGLLEENIMTLLYYPAFFSLLLVRHLVNNYPVQYKGETLHECKQIFNVLFYPLLWIPLVSGYLLIKGIGNHNWWIAIIIWSMSMIIISDIGKTVDYILLGYVSAIFMSEYYEIPIYIGRCTRGVFLTSSSLMILIPKLLFIFIVLYIMNEIGINYRKYLSMLFGFSCFYITVSYSLYMFTWHMPIMCRLGSMLMRIAVIGFTTLFIYDETKHLRSVRNG